MINGVNNKLVAKYKLRKGENNIQIIIKEEITDFSDMFSECSSLSDIKSLENWNISNGTDFSYMFWGCSLLLDIKSLERYKIIRKLECFKWN